MMTGKIDNDDGHDIYDNAAKYWKFNFYKDYVNDDKIADKVGDNRKEINGNREKNEKDERYQRYQRQSCR